MQQKALLAFSGGVDSVVLAHALQQAGISFTLAHCNFRLRGAESTRDEDFARTFAASIGADIEVRQFDTEAFAADNKLSIQEAARELRYHWFRQLMQERGLAYILTAHHADDNIETMLLHFFRGSGLKGLTGIPVLSPDKKIFRPMLDIRRQMILEYAVANSLQWVEDSSNQSVKYTRNFLRHEMIPQLKQHFPGIEAGLLSTISRFRKTRVLYEERVDQLRKKLEVKEGNAVKFPVARLLALRHTSLLYEIASGFGFSEGQAEEMDRLLESASGRYVSNGLYQAIRHDKWLIIAPVSGETGIYIIEGPGETAFEAGIIEVAASKDTIAGNAAHIALLDARQISFPLVLRRWKQGDYFYPLGMEKKKKLARFLIDQKVSRNQKEAVWVIESEKRILWVVGHRIDNRFRIRDDSRNSIKITFKGKNAG